jgi:hypothetical protein
VFQPAKTFPVLARLLVLSKTVTVSPFWYGELLSIGASPLVFPLPLYVTVRAGVALLVVPLSQLATVIPNDNTITNIPSHNPFFVIFTLLWQKIKISKKSLYETQRRLAPGRLLYRPKSPGGAAKPSASHGHNVLVGLIKKAEPFLSSTGPSVPKCLAEGFAAPPGAFIDY